MRTFSNKERKYSFFISLEQVFDGKRIFFKKWLLFQKKSVKLHDFFEVGDFFRLQTIICHQQSYSSNKNFNNE